MADVKTPNDFDELLRSARMTPGSVQGEHLGRDVTPPTAATPIIPTLKAESVFTSTVTVNRTLEYPEPTVQHRAHATTFNEWDRLHDATLLQLVSDWGSGETRITLRLNAQTTGEILVTGTTRATCPRTQPWGPSLLVNEARLTPTATGHTLALSIQSGDVLELEGTRIELRIDG
jgi:hypothetical protein